MPAPKERPVCFRAAKPNPGIRAAYRRALESAVRAMKDDVERAVLAEWDAAAWRMRPSGAQDGAPWRTPAERLNDLLDGISSRWLRRFAIMSGLLSGRFAKAVLRGVQSNRRMALKDAGLYVGIRPSRYTKDAVQASIAENVSLIKSIPQQYLERVRGAVNRAVASGMDRGGLARELSEGYGVTERRAAFISRDQTNKATAALAASTDADLGVTEGIWVHVPGRKTSRPSHVRMNGQKFRLDEGLWDPDVRKKVKCGELPGCACIYRPVWPAAFLGGRKQ